MINNRPKGIKIDPTRLLTKTTKSDAKKSFPNKLKGEN